MLGVLEDKKPPTLLVEALVDSGVVGPPGGDLKEPVRSNEDDLLLLLDLSYLPAKVKLELTS